MSTPTYQGANQPTADGGGSWLARLGSFFGRGGTPTYAGIGQPTGSVGALGGGAPAYAPAPVVTPPKDSVSNATDIIAVQVPMCCPIDPTMCPIDPAALAAGQIAIVIPRGALGPADTWIAEMQK